MEFKMGGFGFSMYEPEPTRLRIDIYDDIGEKRDFWTDEIRGFGETKLREILDSSNATTLEVRINSRGGDVFAGIAVYNILRSCGKTVETYVDGMAASAASVIAMAGETVHMFKTSQLMIHNCYSFAQGTAEDFRKLADTMDKIMGSVKIAYIDQGGDLVEPYIDELLNAETYMTAQEALSYGLCDVIDDATGADPADEPEDEPAEEEKVDEPEPETEKVENHRTTWFW